MENKHCGHSANDSYTSDPSAINRLTNLMASTIISNDNTSSNSVQPTRDHSDQIRVNKPLDKTSKLVHDFLLEHEAEFVRVTEFRNRGWYENKAQGDAFFTSQRDRADNADHESRKIFHEMMLQIATEMHHVTGSLHVEGTRPSDMKVLDICAAPGGYTEATLRHNPRASAFCITLPVDLGGHPFVVNKAKLSGLSFIDVTLLLKEYADDKPIPSLYPNKSIFLLNRPFRFHRFDLIFCDGKVLRTHERPTYREATEVTRLTYSQLILALQRIRPGGTLIMLLHKADLWPSVLILYTFSKFAEVQVFKPAKKHASRSSFYMIAKAIQPASREAKAAVQDWKNGWWESTFGGADGLGAKEEHDENFVLKVLNEFGDRLMELGRPIWRIQADALSKTDYAGRSKDIIESANCSEGNTANNKIVRSEKGKKDFAANATTSH